MIDEHKLLREQDRALGADALLKNDLFNEALESIERDLIEAWKAALPRDTDGRERIWAAIQQLGKIKGYIETVLRDGKLASAQLKDLAEQPKRSFFG